MGIESQGDAEAFLNELIGKRRQLIDGLDANKDEVNLDIFEDFYPDRAHFVYELLQNAEDAGATEITFTLTNDKLVCMHDGQRTFTRGDVTAITGIHSSKKAKAKNQIGKFGVGFKSVFVYTQSPTVRSGEFSFRILQLILPERIPPDPSIGNKTRFEFPFDNPDKPPKEAYADIATGLQDLDETTLLFLSSLQTVRWRVGNDFGEVSRRMHAESHFEIFKSSGDRVTGRSYFLKFDQPVAGLDKQTVSLAFPLEFLAGVKEYDAGRPLAQQMRIVPASQGRVAVFFTAVKETSGFLFHLHGPFVPELSRASIKETTENEPLFKQLAELAAQCLYKIRDFGLLTAEFLAVLPNPQDQIPARYQPIRTAIINAMKSGPLTPTHERDHAPATQLVQAKAAQKSLLSKEDLKFLIEHKDVPPLWAIAATQRSNRVDNFLSGLSIREWGVDALVGELTSRASTGTRYISVSPYYVQGPDKAFMEWLGQKSPEWLQQFYGLLHDDTIQSGLHRLRGLKLVRLQDGTFEVAANAFFGNDETDDNVATVDPRVFTSGRSKPVQEKARKFLSDLGVRELGEAEEVELILKARYTEEAEVPDDKTYRRDLKRFVGLVEQQPATAKLFGPYYVFQGEKEQWHTPGSIYLDQPYQETDLSAYYSRLGKNTECVALHARYQDCGIALKRITAFAKAVGAITNLTISEGYCHNNPQWPYLRSVGGDRHTSPIDRDYFIPMIMELLKTPSLALSRLIWRTLTSISPGSHYWKATYQRNNSWGARTAESRLVHELRAAKWVPQRDGQFVRPSDAMRQLLPEGFPFDVGNAGLKAVEFGVEVSRQATQQEQKDSIAKKAGFADASALERAQRFAALPAEEQERFFAELERAAKAAVPDRDPVNPERRARNAEQAAEAPDKETEIRARSVSLGREDMKVEAEQYLRQHYRNRDGEMTCQICKGPLPFKLDDGTEFFETVEFVPGLQKRHFQNYLALCPNHSAMYRHANASKTMICEMVQDLEGDELEVTLAQQDLTIYISKIHLIDIKAVLAAEDDLPSDAEDDCAA
ncbi:sacsin N-terminal ATP-binding-like domain-containing protein [Bradyrhizobium acaciae]|uniref:sacsin N-terminal ATP-binding-like domain-containing protein n=1 Tax=Bradyrhizobium acaciae TaxID=2683706 RepID=UPI001E633F74|nr:hypothetical protein [Bradyrhizobium acaciae]MCC8978915.1 hypothetical protein [Bradyrhizobium acaciae]